MVTTDNGGRILAQCEEFMEVFRNVKAETLPPHNPNYHTVNLEPGHKLPYGLIYNVSEFELKRPKAYI